MVQSIMPNFPSVVRYLPWLLLLGYFVLGSVTLTSGHGWGDDWAQYILHARNILNGRPYGDTGYLFNPDNPSIGPPNYPPGLPFVLAPAIAVFGVNIVALKIVCFVCVVAAFPLIFNVLRASLGGAVALFSVGLFALNCDVWTLRDYISSEAPYILFSSLTLWWAADGASRPRGFWPSLRAGTLLGLFVFLSVACRSIGISLLIALLVHGWSQRRPLSWLLSLIASFSLLIWLQTLLLVAPTAYEHELKTPTIELVLQNLNGYRVALGWLFPLPFKLSQFAAVPIVGLAAIGVANICARRDATTQQIWSVRGFAARVPLFLWYLLAYLSALTLAAIEPGQRYLLPVLPFIIALATTGVFTLARHLPNPQRYVPPAMAAIVIYYVAQYAALARPQPDESAVCDACQQMYAFVRTRTPPDAVIAFAKPRVMALMAGRTSWMWSTKYSPEEFRRRLRDVGVSVLVIAAPGTALAERYYPASLDFTALTHDSSSKVLFQNGMFTAIRVAAGGEKQ